MVVNAEGDEEQEVLQEPGRHPGSAARQGVVVAYEGGAAQDEQQVEGREMVGKEEQARDERRLQEHDDVVAHAHADFVVEVRAVVVGESQQELPEEEGGVHPEAWGQAAVVREPVGEPGGEVGGDVLRLAAQQHPCQAEP